jgi:hypothetical protein
LSAWSAEGLAAEVRTYTFPEPEQQP